MDFIEKKYEELRNYLKDVGLQRAMMIYIVVALLVTILSIIVIRNFIDKWCYIIYTTSLDTYDIPMQILTNDFFRYSNYGEEIIKQINMLTFIENVIICIIIIITTVIVTRLYYNTKLKEPLRIIEKEIKLLKKNDLSFDCSYLSGDEMGRVCNSLNTMRLQLLNNKKNIWMLKENQKAINAAFAHDIRTPLTVMRGYVQIMLKFSKTNQITQAKSNEILMLLDEQVNKMERFTDTMKEINDFEEWELNVILVERKKLYDQMLQIVESMQEVNLNIEIKFDSLIDVCEMEYLYCDLDIVQQVIVNLINNAVRYANNKINVQLMKQGEHLYVYIQDDGVGFLDSTIKKAMNPYFTTDKNHFGMGLFISQMLCKKHGGNLEIMNGLNGGGIVVANFFIGKI